METITPENSIFRDEDALRDHYPDRILERDEKLSQYLNEFTEVVRNKRPRNVFVYGPTGVGKTIGTKAVFDRVEKSIEEYDYDSNPNIDEPSVKTIHVDCKDLNTSYQVAAWLVNEFRKDSERDQISPTGYPESEVYRMLFEELRDIDETHALIALDEIDNIGKDDNILYKLPRCNNDNSANHVDPDQTKVGVVGITNDPQFKDDLDPRARSTLCEREIHFPPYDANELQTILSDRAEQAFHDGVLANGVVPLTAALSAQRDGYARTALDLLFEAGALARARGEPEVTEDHVHEAEESIQRGAIVQEIDTLSTHAKVITYTLLRLHEEDETPAKLDKVYAWYERLANQIGADPVTSRTVHKTLNNLMMNSIATSKEINRGRAGGRHYEYDIGARPDLIVDGLAGDNRLAELDDRI